MPLRQESFSQDVLVVEQFLQQLCLLFVSHSQIGVSSTVTLVHDFHVLVCQLAWIAEQFIGSWNLAFDFTFTDGRGDGDTFVVWGKFAVVVPELHVTTADPSLLTSVSSFEKMDLSTAFLAGERGDVSFACDGCVVGLHWTQLSVAFTFVDGVAEDFTSFAAVFGWCAFSVSGLGAASA